MAIIINVNFNGKEEQRQIGEGLRKALNLPKNNPIQIIEVSSRLIRIVVGDKSKSDMKFDVDYSEVLKQRKRQEAINRFTKLYDHVNQNETEYNTQLFGFLLDGLERFYYNPNTVMETNVTLRREHQNPDHKIDMVSNNPIEDIRPRWSNHPMGWVMWMT